MASNSRDAPAWASWVLGLKARASTAWLFQGFSSEITWDPVRLVLCMLRWWLNFCRGFDLCAVFYLLISMWWEGNSWNEADWNLVCDLFNILLNLVWRHFNSLTCTGGDQAPALTCSLLSQCFAGILLRNLHVHKGSWSVIFFIGLHIWVTVAS